MLSAKQRLQSSMQRSRLRRLRSSNTKLACNRVLLAPTELAVFHATIACARVLLAPLALVVLCTTLACACIQLKLVFACVPLAPAALAVFHNHNDALFRSRLPSLQYIACL